MAVELGRGCASRGWVLSIYGDHAQWLGTFPREAQDEVWRADPDALICTCYAPMGKARAVDGGTFDVTGAADTCRRSTRRGATSAHHSHADTPISRLKSTTP